MHYHFHGSTYYGSIIPNADESIRTNSVQAIKDINEEIDVFDETCIHNSKSACPYNELKGQALHYF